jgi:hypothetical protein
MKRLSHMLVCSLLILGALAGLCRFQPEWLAPAGLDFGDVPATMRRYAEQVKRGKRLDEALEDGLDRIEARQRVVRDVIDRRLSLAEAAARFQELDLASPTFNWERFRAETPGATDEERQCRAVLRHVCSELAEDPGRAQAEGRRLEAELRELLSHGGQQPDVCPWEGGCSAPARGTPWCRPGIENR